MRDDPSDVTALGLLSTKNSPDKRDGVTGGVGVAQQWTIEELHDQLARFEAELFAAGLSPGTVHTYVDRTDRFLRWLNGEYVAGQGLGAGPVRSKGRG